MLEILMVRKLNIGEMDDIGNNISGNFLYSSCEGGGG